MFNIYIEMIKDCIEFCNKAEAILNERIKSPADIDYYFNRLIKWRSKCA